MRFKRQKVDRSPERFVPYPARYMSELQAHIEEHKLAFRDPVFRMTDRRRMEAAHRRAAEAIGCGDLRLKDLRHLTAIAWARAGARIERAKEWLAHSTIKLTEIYTHFAPDDSFDEPAAERAANIAEGTLGVLERSALRIA